MKRALSLLDNVSGGGRTLDDIELRRQDEAYLDLLGGRRIPDPTRPGDFPRRLDRGQIDALAEAAGDTRQLVWRQQPRASF